MRSEILGRYQLDILILQSIHCKLEIQIWRTGDFDFTGLFFQDIKAFALIKERNSLGTTQISHTFSRWPVFTRSIWVFLLYFSLHLCLPIISKTCKMVSLSFFLVSKIIPLSHTRRISEEKSGNDKSPQWDCDSVYLPECWNRRDAIALVWSTTLSQL